MSQERRATVKRETAETQIQIDLNIDGSGKFESNLNVPFLNHMLHLLTRHALFDMTVCGAGDVHIDDHHTVEDCGIVLGQVLKVALGDKIGIARYGTGAVPMEECLGRCVLDICNRPFFVYDVALAKTKVGTFDVELGEEFFRALAFSAGITMHLDLLRGTNAHHILEALFKATGLALRHAVAIDPRITGVLSTKESI